MQVSGGSNAADAMSPRFIREVWLTRKGEARNFSSQVCKDAYDRGHITEEPCEGLTLMHGSGAEPGW